MKRAAIIVLVMFALLPGWAEAHASLVRSDPPIGAVVATAPHELVLEFSEDLDASFSRVQLLNSKNAVVNAGPGIIDSTSPKVLHLSLDDLPQDSYIALWRTRSAIDGHTAEGSVPFGVGVASTASLIPPLGAPDPALESPPVSESIVRWLDLLVLAVMLGGLPFGLFVLASSGGRRQVSSVNDDLRITQHIQRLIIGSAAIFALTSIALLVVQAANAADVPLAQVIGTPLVEILGGRDGLILFARLVLTLALVGVAWRLPPVRQAARRWWLALALGAALILTWSLTSHAATLENAWLAIAIDWLHLAAMITWLGGLVPLASIIRQTARTTNQEPRTELGAIIPRFSRVALSCVVVLTGSGLYSYVNHIGALELLPATTYGRALLVKIMLFGVLLLIGALNLLVFSRRLASSSSRVARVFSRTVRVEIVIGALLLLAVGALTSVAPSKAAWDMHRQQGVVQRATVDNVDLTLRIAPAHVGDNQLAVDVRDTRPGAQQAVSKVLLRFTMADMAITPLQIDTTTSDAQRYIARGNVLSMAGRWQIEVVFRSSGFDDVRHTFDVDVGTDTTSN